MACSSNPPPWVMDEMLRMERENLQSCVDSAPEDEWEAMCMDD